MCDLDPDLVAASGERPHPTVDRMVQLAGIGADRPVSVAGPASLPMLIALCRMGFDRVECARQATCGGADGLSEALFVSGPCTGAELSLTLSRTLRLLADGGVLVVHEASLDDDLALEARLAELGVEVEWKVHDMAKDTLVALRLRRRPPGGRLTPAVPSALLAA